jgi:GT2 family glycosyltransferase/glycosyltransferase involved in cell wall biosynthesis
MSQPAWGSGLRQRLRLAPLRAALALADLAPRHAPRARRAACGAGISVIIPDRDAPDLLARSLSSVRLALQALAEPHELIVVGNGTPRSHYAKLGERRPQIKLIHSERPLGFSTAVRRGAAAARYPWTLLLNNDMILEPDAVARLAACRRDDVFAVGAQIFQRSADGRREESGLVDWYADDGGIHVYHAPVDGRIDPCDSLCASGGAALYRTATLRRYARASACYDPFYWEDVEWGLRARREGMRVLFCPSARVHHRHRATTRRFYPEAELERIVERNRILFDLRHRATGDAPAAQMRRVCNLPYASQRELARPSVAARVLAARRRAPDVDSAVKDSTVLEPPKLDAVTRSSFTYRLRPPSSRPTLLLVTPYCVFPARHGGARRIEGLLRHLRDAYDVVLVSDEATLHDARSFAHFDGLRAVHLVQRPDAASSQDDLARRMRTHCHPALREAVQVALHEHQPDLVQVEHAELAPLAALRASGQRWILGLHDAFDDADFADAAEAARLREQLRTRYDAVTVCSDSDGAMVDHPRTVYIANGARDPTVEPSPSRAARLLFIGPFRYAPNRQGIEAFLLRAYPAIRAAVPDVTLQILGGDGAGASTRDDPAFTQPGVEVFDHRDDVDALIEACTLTINPLSAIRGSAIKLIESLAAGRACVSTREAARGFSAAGLAGLVMVGDVGSMATPIIGLLGNPSLRHGIERPDMRRLAPFTWRHSAHRQHALYRELLEAAR